MFGINKKLREMYKLMYMLRNMCLLRVYILLRGFLYIYISGKYENRT